MSAIILTPQNNDEDFNPLFGFGLSGAVYDPYVLWRSYLEWKDKTHIMISSDMRPILERTYEERDEVGKTAASKLELLKKRDMLKRFAFNGMSLTQTIHDDETAQTRYSELATCPVLLLTKDPQPHSPLRHLLDGSVIDTSVTTKEEQKKVAIQILKNLITVTSYVSPNALSLGEERWMRRFHHISDNPDTRIKVAVLDESGAIRRVGGGEANESYQLSYSRVLGYVAEKKKEEESQ